MKTDEVITQMKVFNALIKEGSYKPSPTVNVKTRLISMRVALSQGNRITLDLNVDYSDAVKQPTIKKASTQKQPSSSDDDSDEEIEDDNEDDDEDDNEADKKQWQKKKMMKKSFAGRLTCQP